jgi:hypothetical protein
LSLSDPRFHPAAPPAFVPRRAPTGEFSMPRLFCIVPLLSVLVLVRPCVAQEEAVDADAERSRASSAQATLTTISRTPEMWFYEQERIRYEDPKLAVRRRAELRAAKRSERNAAQQWYGISNSRPMVSCTPLLDGYSPSWTSNTYDPKRWRPYGTPSVVALPIVIRY